MLGNAARAMVRGLAVWRHGIFPRRHLAELSRYESLAAEEKRKESLALLKQVFFRAYHSVPYYKQTLDDARLSPRDIRQPEDLAHFPILQKADVAAQPERMISRSSRTIGASWDATGGSTGEPLRFLVSKRARSFTFANEQRVWRWYGLHPGARQAFVWGADRDLAPETSAAQVRNRLLGVRELNAFRLDEHRCAVFADLLRRFKPHVIYGYASALAQFASYLGEDLPVSRFQPVAIRSTAEVLLPSQRQLVAEKLHAPVYDYYGSREVGPMAGESPLRQGLHVFSDLVYLEIVRPDGSHCEEGEAGDILATKLREDAMPLLRYRTGDRGTWAPADVVDPMGFPRLESIQGRIGEFIEAVNGQLIHGEFFTHLFYGIHGVLRFQVHQPTRTTLRILVQTTDAVDESRLRDLTRLAAERFGAEDESMVTLVRVQEIAPEPSGKHRFVIPYRSSSSAMS